MSHQPYDPHSRNLRKGRASEPYACYSITKKTAGRKKVLTSGSIARIIFESWGYLRRNNEIKIISFCLMPDHYHLLCCLLNKKTLSEVVGSTSKFTGREINLLSGVRGRFWQEGFHDHRCRYDRDAEELSVYIEHNPVRAGLVGSAEHWAYSSAFPANKQLLDRDWYAVAR